MIKFKDKFDSLHIDQSLRQKITEVLKPTIRFGFNDSTSNLGQSRFGGTPDLPDNLKWPHNKSIPLSFIAQINLADLSKFDTDNLLPDTGIIYFFYDNLNQPWGFNPEDILGLKVMYSNEVQSLTSRKTPSYVSRLSLFDKILFRKPQEVSITEFDTAYLAPFLDVSCPDFSDLDAPDYESWDIDEEVLETTLDAFADDDEVVHKMFGFADIIQFDMKTECELMSRGLDFEKLKTVSHQVKADIDKCAKQWILLLQVDSSDTTKMYWGDSGKLYFWIKKDDLLKLKLDHVQAILQCY